MLIGQGAAARGGGFLFCGRGELAARLLAAWRQAGRVICHAVGNLGVETAVGAIEDALRAHPAGRERVRIDHAMFLERELIARLADLGVWVVAQPSFLSDSGGVAPSPELLLRPFRSVHAAGIPQAFSSDFPCGALAPLAGIAAAVTRRSRAGAPAGPQAAPARPHAPRAAARRQACRWTPSPPTQDSSTRIVESSSGATASGLPESSAKSARLPASRLPRSSSSPAARAAPSV